MSLRTIVENNGRKVKKLQKIVDEVNKLADSYSKMNDQELKSETLKLKTEISNGKSLDDILPRAFAAIREADKRVLGLYPYDVQVMGGIVLHQGNLAEMQTGEGKTLTETMPVYLNALSGKGVYVVTVNEYLSKRDFEEMGPVFEYMGLTVGLNSENNTSLAEKKTAYLCDITYTTNDSLAFDYLRDNMCKYTEDQVQRELNYCIVDEADSILIDEARTPLIISGSAKSYQMLYKQADAVAKRMLPSDYNLDPETKTIVLERSGIEKANDQLGITNLYDSESYILSHYVDEAMRANYTMEKDRDYIVRDGQVLIVDSFTGRVMEGRRFSDGLHQAIEAKEGVKINDANKTEASITYQNFFRMFKKLSGMTGTASTESKEFYETFGMQVITIPTNKPSRRKDLPDILYPTEKSKFLAVIDLICEVHKTGQPVLVGTASVEHSEYLSDLLTEKQVPNAYLNAKNDKHEAEIIAQAGQKGAITIATNMAGRGTDIKLGPGVEQLGGLYVIGTEKHESRRIDNQLRGRAGRQGNPGTTVFYLSLEDEIVERFDDKKVQEVKQAIVKAGDEFKPIVKNKKIVIRAVTNAQKKAEGNNFDQRKNTLRYDDVMNSERLALYKSRQRVLESSKDFNNTILAMINRSINRTVDRYYLDEKNVNYDGLFKKIRESYDIDLNVEKCKKLSKKELKECIYKLANTEWTSKLDKFVSQSDIVTFEKFVITASIDANWKNLIDRMEQLRQSITLRGYANYNPLIEYQNSGHTMYEQMGEDIEDDISRDLLMTHVLRKDQ